MSSHMPNNNTLVQRRTSRCSNQSGSHPYRVEKPKSNSNSPMFAERRKTTTGAKLYASLDDHYRMMVGMTDDDDMEDHFEPAPRPMSWHPSSTHFNVQTPMEHTQPQDWSYSSDNTALNSDMYSMSAQNSTYNEPTQYYTSYPSEFQTHRGSQDSDSSYQTQPFSSYSTPATDSMPWYLQEWARRNQEQTMDVQQVSTDFLPNQEPTVEQEAEEDMGDSGKELVGMGLYDVPDPTDGWGSLVEATGKGLKLEETWQPPEENDDDDDDEEEEEEEEEDDASSDDGEEELPPPPPAQQQPQQLNVPVSKPQLPNTMTGQSFFFEEDDSVTKEWWFHQLQQSTMPVRDAGIGYGWL
ncbi:hypothetical protein P280DRAFT_485927 [Massarina eburnea CBS 473.64]|uniref:Uncharacterized protein n=1 Tax=Massarina eburnea CBS 473.64 TaxID=1395130 RepID=A0A6A6SFX9_9PLEO|nr:hypothetical protein P280DRAFT_485927 [Massarina eburnea CBS 473.64]